MALLQSLSVLRPVMTDDQIEPRKHNSMSEHELPLNLSQCEHVLDYENEIKKATSFHAQTTTNSP